MSTYPSHTDFRWFREWYDGLRGLPTFQDVRVYVWKAQDLLLRLSFRILPLRNIFHWV